AVARDFAGERARPESHGRRQKRIEGGEPPAVVRRTQPRILPPAAPTRNARRAALPSRRVAARSPPRRTACRRSGTTSPARTRPRSRDALRAFARSGQACPTPPPP